MENHYNGEMGYGGFLLDNIRTWVIEECLSSGSPIQFFWNLQRVIKDLDDDHNWMKPNERVRHVTE